MRESNRIFLHTGSNIGDVHANLLQANQLIHNQIGPIITCSKIYATEAWGNINQASFVNQALELHTDLSPSQVLESILGIEKEMGRSRIEKWGPRIIDIDLLFYNDLVYKSDVLTVPHPFLHQRNFVLVPMNEIAEEFIHPILQKTIEELYLACDDNKEVVLAESIKQQKL